MDHAAEFQRLSPALLRAEIGRRGAHAVVAKLVGGGEWEAVLAHIDAGAGSWVALTLALAPGTDAGASEELGIALSYALPRNPMAVLAVLDPNNGGDAPKVSFGSRLCKNAYF